MSIAEKIMATYSVVNALDIFVNIEYAKLAIVVTDEPRLMFFNTSYGDLRGEYLDEKGEWKTLPADDKEPHFELGLI